MKKTLFIVLTLLAALLVCVSCDNSLDADVFTPDPTPETDPNKMPLTLEFVEAGELTITPHGEYGAFDVYYSINGGEKTLYSAPVSAAAGDKVTLYRTLENAKVTYRYITIGCSKDCYVYGNVMSLIDPDNYATKTKVVARAFLGLFIGNTHIKNHESIDLVLPATTLADSCYAGMFDGCTGLTKAPILPATTLSDACYRGMFNGCTGLTKAPELPATTLADSCYYEMFNGCTGLTKAPILPATTLAYACYRGMFNGCTGLTKAPELSAEELKDFCYYHMFYGCSKLSSITCLATVLASESVGFWLTDAGTDVTGTKEFHCKAGLTIWESGVNVPADWTIVADK